MTTDLGQALARPDEAVPRPRRGAHAANKGGRFRRKGGSGPPPQPDASLAPAVSPAPPAPPAVGPAPPTPPAVGPAPPAPPAVGPAPAAPPAGPAPVPMPRGAARPVWSPAPVTMTASGAQAASGPVEIGRAGSRAAAVRSAATAFCAVALVAVVIPLIALQIPEAIGWALPPRLAAAGPNAVASLLRAAGLAVPAMAVAAPLGALAVRRLRAGPVLLAGLLVIAAADALGGAAGTVLAIGVDRTLHGLGAGSAMAAVVAVVAEQRTARRSLAGWWAAITVAALAAAPEVMRYRVTAGDWHAALQPYPWLTGTALGLGALYAVLAEGTAVTAARSAFPVAERSHLALLAAPVAGMCAIAVAVTCRGDKAVAAVAIADVIALSGIVAMTARAAAGRFAVVCAVTGFTLAPAAGAVTALTPPAVPAGAAALAASLGGAAMALLPRYPAGGSVVMIRAITAAGLGLAASGFAVLYLAGAENPQGRMLLVCAPLAGGLSAALTSSLRAAGAAGAMAGVVILLAGVVAGYLAAGSMQLNTLTGARTGQAVRHALVLAAGRWALVAAAVTAVVALALAGPGLAGRAVPAAGLRSGGGRSGRRSGPAVAREPDSESGQIAVGSPLPGAGRTPGHE